MFLAQGIVPTKEQLRTVPLSSIKLTKEDLLQIGQPKMSSEVETLLKKKGLL